VQNLGGSGQQVSKAGWLLNGQGSDPGQGRLALQGGGKRKEFDKDQEAILQEAKGSCMQRETRGKRGQ
jgi:hypothetical protein